MGVSSKGHKIEVEGGREAVEAVLVVQVVDNGGQGSSYSTRDSSVSLR
jgi:hypothetical protein